ncbi:MAG: aquaporin [Chloroflexota bacterium]
MTREGSMNIRALVAEAVGTFVLVFFGSLGVATYVIVTQGQGAPLYALVILPFAFGLGLMAAIGIGGHVSGGHFNPAVTLAALFDGRLDWMNALGYVVAQVIGAFAASIGVLLVTTMGIVQASVNQPGPTAEAQFDMELHAFALEAILTAVFIAVILTVTKKSPGQAIVVIPLTLLVIHFVGIFTSGASVNPARSLAPAVVSGTYGSLWVYLTGPFVGSILGWAIYRFLTPPDEDLEEATEDLDDEFEELDEDDDA